MAIVICSNILYESHKELYPNNFPLLLSPIVLQQKSLVCSRPGQNKSVIAHLAQTACMYYACN